MKIVSWNATGKFREKYKAILELDADIYVIQECENPETRKNPGYRDFFKNYHWAGVYSYKGLMVLILVQTFLLNALIGARRITAPLYRS